MKKRVNLYSVFLFAACLPVIMAVIGLIDSITEEKSIGGYVVRIVISVILLVVYVRLVNKSLDDPIIDEDDDHGKKK